MPQQFPKRLIEVDLPIKRISVHARREKSIRHGHISTLHTWWARRPLAACRAVICAALWPDPDDCLCPQEFRDRACAAINKFALAVVSGKDLSGHCSRENWVKWQALVRTGGLNSSAPAHWNVLRFCLLDFIADFANWDNATAPEYLEASRALTQAAHEALGGTPGTRPLVVDPFAGGGSIPIEALRVGADALASDLNPIPILLNKVVLEYIPKYGQRLRDEVRKWGDFIKAEAEKRLAEFYPADEDGATPMAYLWARTLECEGPGCGAEIPLLRSLWLAKRPNHSVALQMFPNPIEGRVDLRIIVKEKGGWIFQDQPHVSLANPELEGTVKRGSATCPCCGYTTPVKHVREQLTRRAGGAQDARLLSVVTVNTAKSGRTYRLASDRDTEVVELARARLNELRRNHHGTLSLLPDEKVPITELRRISVPLYGLNDWGAFFSPRPALALVVLSSAVSRISDVATPEDAEFQRAVKTCLAFAVSKQADFNSSLSRWANHMEKSVATFSRQALGMLWDWGEVCPLGSSTGSFDVALSWVINALDQQWLDHSGQVTRASATSPILPDDSAQLLFTDPPYYDAIPYSHLSDFFYVWLKRCLWAEFPDLFSTEIAPKDGEIVVDRPHSRGGSIKTAIYYERELTKAFANARRITALDGCGVIVFASKTTASWEAVLGAIVEGGWVITGSWPIDTEKADRMNAIGTASLASSVHIVCRPRESSRGMAHSSDIGDWRDVLLELPRRIHEWMPRLAAEGVVGADAIFACLGPALEIFSRHSRVEKANGEIVYLREYLEQVWAAVAKAALAMVFEGADATGFEADARLTAMWLWTLKDGDVDLVVGADDDEQDSDDESESAAKKVKAGGVVLEYDAARKIAQGLGANLEALDNLVEISGETARLLPVAERMKHLFGKDEEQAPTRTTKKKSPQLEMFSELVESGESEAVWREKTVQRVGETTLDRVHQSMILFAAGRGEALKRFLVEEGVGRDGRFWRLAQALSALYSRNGEEKRWVDGVLARKKGLGF